MLVSDMVMSLILIVFLFACDMSLCSGRGVVWNECRRRLPCFCDLLEGVVRDEY